METFRKKGTILMKVGVVDVDKVPKFTRITSAKLFIYHIPVKVTEIVEQGWMRPDNDQFPDFDSIEDLYCGPLEEKNPKKRKGSDADPPSPSQLIIAETGVRASQQTIHALQERERLLREQDALDAETYGMQSRQKNKTVEVENESNKRQSQNEKYDEVEDDKESFEEDTGKGEDKQSQEEYEDDSQESLGAKIKKIMPNFRNKSGEVTEQVEKDGHQRYSDRLADKYNDDIPVLDRAKNLAKTKNLDNNAGTCSEPIIVSDTTDYTLLDIADVVGVSLGTSLDMISENLSLL
jgi:hypothetical protein